MKKILTPRGIKLLMLAFAFYPAVSIPAYAQEEARYVSDVVVIPLRKAPGGQQEIIVNGLKSGTRLTFVREELDNNRVSWSLVRTESGILGWARTQQLVSEPPAAAILPELQQQYDAATRELEHLRQTSARSIDIDQENQRLNESYQLLQTRADFLQAENDKLKNADRYNQWMYGGGLLLLGVILSFVLQGLGKRKRQSEWR